MDESGCSAFEAYQQKQKDDEEDIEDLSEDCNVIFPRKRKAAQSENSAKKKRDDDQETARALGSRRDRVRHKLKRKSSSRANKDKKVAKETTRSCESQEGDPMAENNPMESTSQLPSFKERFYMDYYRESHGDSRQTARQLFELMITPYPVDKFFSEVWEQKPLVLRRTCPHYNDGWFGSEEMDEILRKHVLEYSVNINLTSYTDGKRLAHNPEGRAHASTIWDFFSKGCSVQLLNPQTYSDTMWLLQSILQELFGSFVGANIYLTPAGTQGFAPHYDDIEAFVLQVEGRKRWRLYSAKDNSGILPRTSSENLGQEDIGQPILDAILEPGDLLYFPRGIIHQATALPDNHSLHITLSAAQKTTWGDLLEKLLPVALQSAIEEDVDFRKSLPIDYLQYMGVANFDFDTSQTEDSCRNSFIKKLGDLFDRIIQYGPVDAAVDQMAIQHIHSCLPPLITTEERKLGVWEKGSSWRNGQVKPGTEITGDSEVKLLRHGVLRLVVEEDTGPIVYYTTDNSRVYQAKELQILPIRAEEGPGIEHLLSTYPDYVAVCTLPVENGDDEDNTSQVALCNKLFSKGLLLVK